MRGLNFKINTDPRFMFSNKIRDNMYDYRKANGLNAQGPVDEYKFKRQFVPDGSVFFPEQYNGYRPKGYDRYGNFNPGSINTSLDYSFNPTYTKGNSPNTDIQRIELPNKIDINPYSINVTPASGGENIIPTGQAIRKDIKRNNRLNKSISKLIGNISVGNNEKTDNTNGSVGTNNDTTTKDKSYNRNLIYNALTSYGRHYPTFDSVQQYMDKKRNTPDYSDIQNAKNYALRPTDVYRQTANHISGNVKFNPYDYTGQANMINAQSANGINAISRQGRGNINAIAGHINNLLSNTATSAGNAYMQGFETNEKNRLAVAAQNMEAEKYNATADNNAEANYISARNQAAASDKRDGVNAMQEYAREKYAMDNNYETQLRGLRDQMVSNIAEEGRTAYENNRANTNKEFNYWYDRNGVQHYIPQQGGARYVEEHKPEPYQIDENDYVNMYNKYGQDNNVMKELSDNIKTYGPAQGRFMWYNKYKNA